MHPFAAVERFFERIFERPTARLFGARLQPVQLQHRLERAIENERLTGSGGRTLVPNRYTLHLNPRDLASFADLAEPLAAELADACLSYARQHRYTLSDRPQVTLLADDDVGQGEVRVAALFGRPEHEASKAGGAAPATAPPDSAGEPPAAEGPFSQPPQPASEHTMVFEVPRMAAPRATLRLVEPDRAPRSIELDGRSLTLGRSTDNDLVVRDVRVSRHHARIQSRSGSLILSDLGSTNGTRVNGAVVREVVLGAGDTIELGDTVLVVESTPDG